LDYKLVDRFVPGNQRAGEDDGDDRHSRQILDTAETIGEAPARPATSEGEGDPERYRRSRVAEIVDRVGEERDAAGKPDHEQLQNRRDREDREGPFDRPDATVTCRDRRVDRAMAVRVPATMPMKSRSGHVHPLRLPATRRRPRGAAEA